MDGDSPGAPGEAEVSIPSVTLHLGTMVVVAQADSAARGNARQCVEVLSGFSGMSWGPSGPSVAAGEAGGEMPQQEAFVRGASN